MFHEHAFVLLLTEAFFYVAPAPMNNHDLNQRRRMCVRV